MTKEEAIAMAIELNKDGPFFGAGKILYVAQNADGSWNGFPKRPRIGVAEEFECGMSVCLDREWNDDWEKTLSKVPQ